MPTKVKEGRESAMNADEPVSGGHGFLKLNRGPATDALIKERNCFMLISQIALRALYKDQFNVDGLALNEALIGDHDNIGLSRQEYRTAQSKLERWGFAKFRGNGKGTIATLLNSVIYDINSGAANHSTPAQSAQPGPQILPPAKEFEGLHPTVLQNWKNWSAFVDRDESLSDLKRFKKPLTPRQLESLLQEFSFAKDVLLTKCEEIAATFDPNAAGAPVSLHLKLRQYLRMHKEPNE